MEMWTVYLALLALASMLLVVGAWALDRSARARAERDIQDGAHPLPWTPPPDPPPPPRQVRATAHHHDAGTEWCDECVARWWEANS